MRHGKELFSGIQLAIINNLQIDSFKIENPGNLTP